MIELLMYTIIRGNYLYFSHYKGAIMELSLNQEKAINHVNGPALVLAVPGAGKTTVIIHRTINLISNHRVNPDKILSITFSKSSAMDMKNRFEKMYPGFNRTGIKFSTIHSFCYGLIREYAYIKKTDYKLIEEEKNAFNKYNLLKKIYLEINNEYITEEKLEILISAISYIKNMMINPNDFINANKIEIDNFLRIYTVYENYKKRHNLLDFDDMLTISLEILNSNKYLLAKYRDKYNYIQLDEGQDTSKIQMEIIRLLASPKDNLFIVADDDQSIYGFRGAYPQGLFDFKKDYPKGKFFYMENNFRSTKNIVSLSNKFIKKNKTRYNKNITTENSYLEPINIIKVNNIDEQYKYILKGLEENGPNSTAVLFRNNLSAVGLIEILEKNKLPFKTRDTKLKFFNHWLVNEILNLMKFSEDTSRMEIFENLYYKIKGYISKKQINYAKTLDSNACVFDRIMEYPGISEFYKKNLRELKLDFKRITKLKPYDAIKYIESILEYGEYLKENSKKYGMTYDTLKMYIFYLELIAKSTNSLSEFIGRLNHLQYLCSNSNTNSDSITLSTVHSAKGLEFDRVYMVDLIEGEFPNFNQDSSEDLESLEEERRLFYVGMTRAKKYLTLITYKNLEEKQLEQSRFLDELQELD